MLTGSKRGRLSEWLRPGSKRGLSVAGLSFVLGVLSLSSDILVNIYYSCVSVPFPADRGPTTHGNVFARMRPLSCDFGRLLIVLAFLQPSDDLHFLDGCTSLLSCSSGLLAE